MRATFVILALATILVACAAPQAPPAQPAAPQPAPSAPDVPSAPPPTPEGVPSGNNIGTLTAGTDKVLGAHDTAPQTALDIDGFRCDRESRTLTFRFKNNEASRSWQLNNKVPFPAPKDLVAVQVLVNSYQANGNNQPKDLDQNLLFGPNWPFSANCGGTEVLGPGMDVTCTLSPVPLKSGNQLTSGYNEIFIKSPTSNHIIRFTCE